MLLAEVSPHSTPGWGEIQCAYSPSVVAQLKQIPGLKWVPSRKLWVGPLDAIEVVAHMLENAQVAKFVYQRARKPPATQANAIDNDWLTAIADGPLTQYRRYQLDGIVWLANKLLECGFALCADDMGLGKSAEAIATLEIVCPDKPVLILCPSVAVENWHVQLDKWATRFGAECQIDLPADLESAPPLVKLERERLQWANRKWLVLSFDEFASSKGKSLRELGVLNQIGGIVLDEIHYLMTPTAKRTEAVRDFTRSVPHIFRLGLSGTPMTARTSDMHSPLDILAPGHFGSRFSYQARYSNGHHEELKLGNTTRSVWVADGSSNTQELAARLRTFMLRRTKSQVAAELPKLTRQLIAVTPTPEQQKAVLLAAHASTGFDRLHAALRAAEDAKFDPCVELAQQALAAGSRPLIVTHRRDMAARLGRVLNCPAVNGETPAADRRGELTAGNGAGVATIDSITTAIDLVEFDVLIFLGLDWVPSKLLQVEARLDRIGQLRPVMVYYLIAAGTTDERVQQRVLERLDTFAAVTGGDATNGMHAALAGGSEDELLAQLLADVMGGI